MKPASGRTVRAIDVAASGDKNRDRRVDVRWEPEKFDRRKRGIGAERRKGAVWGTEHKG